MYCQRLRRSESGQTDAYRVSTRRRYFVQKLNILALSNMMYSVYMDYEQTIYAFF